MGPKLLTHRSAVAAKTLAPNDTPTTVLPSLLCLNLTAMEESGNTLPVFIHVNGLWSGHEMEAVHHFLAVHDL